MGSWNKQILPAGVTGISSISGFLRNENDSDGPCGGKNVTLSSLSSSFLSYKQATNTHCIRIEI